METRVEARVDKCVGTQKVVTRQQRYAAKMKAARKKRRAEWESRRYRDVSWDFDGRLGGGLRGINDGVPRLGTLNLKKFL